MIRRLIPLLLFGVIGLGWSTAQEPPADDDMPVRLKKKNKAPADPAADPMKQPPAKEKDPKEKDPLKEKEPDPPEVNEDERELLERIGRNMCKVEDQLLNKE